MNKLSLDDITAHVANNIGCFTKKEFKAWIG